MATVKVKLRPSASKNREGRIFFQIIHERIVRQWNSDYKIFSGERDFKNSAIIISESSERRDYLISIRERIKWDTARFKRVIADFSAGREHFTAEEVIEEFMFKQQQQSFFPFMESVIIKLRALGKQRTSETYTAAINSFRRFNNNETVVFDGFNSELMESYEAYLSSRGLIPNSISFHMRILRAVYNRAIEKGITEDKRPFRHVYTGVDKTAKRALDLKTLRKIKDIDLSLIPKVEYARDMFLLSFYFRGMSFVDMAYLKKSDCANGILTYRRRKTGQSLSIKWRPEMQKLLDKYPANSTEYLLPIITSSKASAYSQYRTKQYKINLGLKTVASRIGLDMPLTLYCSRHSWASIAKAKGVPVGIISDGLGHESELTTRIYLSSLDTTAVDRANALILKSL